jgi:hypothetical protein
MQRTLGRNTEVEQELPRGSTGRETGTATQARSAPAVIQRTITDQSSVELLPLPRKTVRELLEGNLDTIGKLCAYKSNWFHCWPRLTRKQVAEIEGVLAELGRRFK